MPRTTGTETIAGTLTLRSPAFTHGGPIPGRYTCDSDNVSPALSFDQVPRDAETLALVMDDPDAPSGAFTHWTWWNLPVSVAALADDAHMREKGAIEGTNSFGDIGYGGPCPPTGTHRYNLRLYALDTTLDLAEGASRKDLDAAIQGHVVAQAELLGTYARA